MDISPAFALSLSAVGQVISIGMYCIAILNRKDKKADDHEKQRKAQEESLQELTRLTYTLFARVQVFEEWRQGHAIVCEERREEILDALKELRWLVNGNHGDSGG